MFAKSVLFFGILLSGVISCKASIIYQFTGNDGTGPISFQYMSQSFISSQTSVSAHALDSCTTHFGSCFEVDFFPQRGNPFYSLLVFTSQTSPNFYESPGYYFPVGTFNSIGTFQSVLYTIPATGISGTLTIIASPEPSTVILGLIGLIAIGVKGLSKIKTKD